MTRESGETRKSRATGWCESESESQRVGPTERERDAAQIHFHRHARTKAVAVARTLAHTFSPHRPHTHAQTKHRAHCTRVNLRRPVPKLKSHIKSRRGGGGGAGFICARFSFKTPFFVKKPSPNVPDPRIHVTLALRGALHRARCRAHLHHLGAAPAPRRGSSHAGRRRGRAGRSWSSP